jgi:protein disulfide-isomerase
VDFPVHKQQSAAEKAQNDQLQSKYRIEGYPTLVILKPDGQTLGTMGYMPGGPKSFIEKLGPIVAG